MIWELLYPQQRKRSSGRLVEAYRVYLNPSLSVNSLNSTLSTRSPLFFGTFKVTAFHNLEIVDACIVLHERFSEAAEKKSCVSRRKATVRSYISPGRCLADAPLSPPAWFASTRPLPDIRSSGAPPIETVEVFITLLYDASLWCSASTFPLSDKSSALISSTMYLLLDVLKTCQML